MYACIHFMLYQDGFLKLLQATPRISKKLDTAVFKSELKPCCFICLLQLGRLYCAKGHVQSEHLQCYSLPEMYLVETNFK